MKVSVTISLDIDPQAWADEYGDPPNLRQDVKSHATQSVLAHFDSVGVLSRTPEGIMKP